MKFVMKNTGFKKEEFVFVAGSILIFIWLCLRAAFVPLVYDEAATFFIYILPKEFIPFFSYWDANNHILNSFLGICSSMLFGYSEFVLRLPNVLFFLLNVFFLFKLKTFFF